MFGCAAVPEVSDVLYDTVDNRHLYALQKWKFQGRLALHSIEDSWSASIHWQHQPENDSLKLSAPLGQGMVTIVLHDGCITIDQGNSDTEFSCNPDELISRRLGVFVPVRDLSFWVLGLPGRDAGSQGIPGGFVQSGWTIQVRQLMRVGNELLPHKIVIISNKTKLKLVIDQWVIDEGYAG